MFAFNLIISDMETTYNLHHARILVIVKSKESFFRLLWVFKLYRPD